MNERELLAQGIRRAILSSGWTEREVALRLNVNASTVHKWSRGYSKPRPISLSRLCGLLEVEQADLEVGHPNWMDHD